MATVKSTSLLPPRQELPMSPLRHGRSVADVAFSSDGTLLATACTDRHQRPYSMPAGKIMRDWKPDVGNEVGAVTFARRGHLLVTADLQRHALRMWVPDCAKSTDTVHFGNSWLQSADFSHDDRWLAFANNDGAVGLYDMLQGRIAATVFVEESWALDNLEVVLHGAPAASPADSEQP